MKIFSQINRKWLILLAIGTGTFMSALDTSVVNTVLPVLTRSFQSEIATVEWVVVIYLLLVSGLLLLFGRLGDLQGHKPVYISGFLVFIISSSLCGLSPNIYSLIAARGFQALGAAMLSANSPAILIKNFPTSQRGQALGLQATMTYLGLIAGPSLGGWLTDLINWRVVFFINVPVGLLALLLSIRFIPHDTVENNIERFDITGAVVFLGGLILLLLGLNRGHDWGWTSPQIIFIILLSAVVLMLFVKIERNQQYPLLDLSLFTSSLFTASVVSAIINYICVYSTIFLLPFYLIQGRGMSASQAGILLAAQPLIMAIVAPVSGTLSDKIGTRLPTTLGMLVMAIGLLSLSSLSHDTSLIVIALLLGLLGLGVGVFISPNNSALMGAAPLHRQGIAAGVMATARNVGMVLGIGLSGAIFTTVLSQVDGDNPTALYYAIRLSFGVISALAVMGIWTSALRGGAQSKNK